MSIFVRSMTAALILAMAAPALAAGQDSASVRYRDLDLASRAGQAALDRRIARAAHIVCDTANERFGNDVRARQRACRQDVAATVRDEVRTRQPRTALAAK